MIFHLVQDFADALAAMPREHPRHRILKLLDEAIRRDSQFIDRHPTTFFQCLWNTCWWYDCPEIAMNYEEPAEGWADIHPPWLRPEEKLYQLLEAWRKSREGKKMLAPWLRSLEPPRFALGSSVGFVLQGHEEVVESIAWTNDGRLISAARSGASAEREVRVWDSERGEELARLYTTADNQPRPLFMEHGSPMWGTTIPCGSIKVQMSGDGRSIVALLTTTEDRIEGIQAWSAESLTRTLYSQIDIEHEECLAISPDAEWIAVAVEIKGEGSPRQIVLRQVDGLAEMAHFQPSEEIESLLISPDGCGIAMASVAGIVTFWKRAGNTIVEAWTHPTAAKPIRFSPDGRVLLLWVEGEYSVCESSSGRKIIAVNNADVPGPCSEMVLTNSLLVGAFARTIRIWNLKDLSAPNELQGHIEDITSLAISPDGSVLASRSTDGEVRTWNLKNGTPVGLSTPTPGEYQVPHVLSQDGRRLTTASGTRVYVFDSNQADSSPPLRR